MNDIEISSFLSVARSGSFTVSARELSSTQQAVSRNIQSLETELGFQLLHRGSSAITLTWAGERFRQWRMEHDAQLSALERQCRRLSPEGMNEIYVAWSDWTGCPVGLEADIRSFCESHPDVRLHARQGSIAEITGMLLDGNADIAILPENTTHNLTGFLVTPPFASQQMYIISRDLTEIPPPEVLGSMPLLASSMGDRTEEAEQRRIQMFCAEIGIAPKQVQLMPNAPSTFTQLMCGGCYTIAPLSSPLNGLHALPLPDVSARLVFVTPQGRISPWVSLLESFLRQRRST